MYAIYYSGSSMIARDSMGGFHIYHSKDEAERVAELLGPGHEVRPYGEGAR